MRLSPPSRASSSLVLVLLLLVASTIGAQQLASNGSKDQATAKIVADMISRHHISQKPIDDRISQMVIKRMLKDLDPQKNYFLESDIAEFNGYRDQLDDFLKQGVVDFGKRMFAVYLERLDQRLVLAHKLVDAPHDFTLDESMPVDGDQIAWAKTPQELDERWRKRIKYDLLSLRLDGKSTPEEDRKRLHRRYDMLKRAAHDTDSGEVLEMYLTSVAHCFDPHSSYMSPQTVEDFQITMRLSLDGIGAALRGEDGFTTVAEVVPGGAAEKDGRLKVGDKIVAVKQAEGEWVDIVEMKLSKVVRLIRGPGGTQVFLRVQTASGETVEYGLIRQKVELQASAVKGVIMPASDWIPGATGRIGVINVPSFYRDFSAAQDGTEDFKSATRDVLKVLRDFRNQGGIDALVIDLRMNGGGALAEAIELSGLFIDTGSVVQVKEQNGKVKSHEDSEPGVAYDGPLVVLCNRLSASASEIFAAAIKDYHRGIVVGDTTTHGKGTVQNVMPVTNQLLRYGNAPDRGALKLTINQFYRVNGDSTQNRGVESDVVLPSLLDHMDLGESFLENALAFDRVEPARHVIYDMVNPGMIASLREASQKRVSADEKFQQTRADIERYLARKNRKTVSLNEETLRREREEDKAANEVAKEEEENENRKADAPVFADNNYNREVLHVVTDYVSLLRNAKTAAR
jgi:carboxyl-terminal processing protease